MREAGKANYNDDMGQKANQAFQSTNRKDISLDQAIYNDIYTRRSTSVPNI